MPRKPFTDRLQESSAKLDDVADAFGQGFQESMERFEGEIWFRNPDAPDRADYWETEQGYEKFLCDCHEWATANLSEAVEGLQRVTERIDVDGYPDLGEMSPADEASRDELDEAIIEATEVLAEVQEWRAKVEKVENGYRQR